MSVFSEKLNYYIKNSGCSIKYLSAVSGIEKTLLVKLKNGTRQAHDEKKVEKLMEAMQLSAAAKSELTEAWEISLVGEKEYSMFAVVRDTLEAIEAPSDDKDKLSMFWCDLKAEKPQDEVVVLNNPSEVSHAIQMARILAMQNPNGYMRIVSNLHNDFICENLQMIVKEKPDFPITHIISLLPSGVGYEGRKENIRRIGRNYPLMVSGRHYKLLYQYEADTGTDTSFLMPNLILTSDIAITISGDWKYGFFFTADNVHTFYENLFERKMSICKVLGAAKNSLEDEMDYYSEVIKKRKGSLFQISRQPCLLAFVRESDAEACHAENIIPEAAMRRFFESYQQQFLTMEKLTFYFDLSGISDFLENGKVYEVLAAAKIVVPQEIRLRILREFLEYAKSFKFILRAFKPGKLNLSNNITINSFDVPDMGGTSFTFEKNSSENYFVIQEPGLAATINEFASFLGQGSWTYSHQETISIIESMLPA